MERIKAIEVCAKPPEKMDKMLEALCRNRDVLIPILARRGIPDEKYKWLLAQEEAYPVQAELTELKDVSLNEESNTTRVPRCQLHTEVSEVEEIPVRDAFRSKSQMMPFDPALIKYLMQQFGGAKNNN